MRGTLIRIIAVFGVALAAAGCQSPGAVGALQPSPFASDMFSGPSDAAPQSTALPASGPVASAPAGFISFCIRFPGQCAAATNTATTVTETPVLWQELNRVNSDVNAAIAPEDDEDHYGRADYWTIPTDGYGDCEDYALTKRKTLIEAGLPEGALRVAVVRLWDGERHAVLTVSTDHGDYVLDNMRAEIVPWFDSGYVWVERQAATNSWNWVALQPDGSAPAIAVAQNSAAPATAQTPSPELRPSLGRQAALPAPLQLAMAAPEVPVAANLTP